MRYHNKKRHLILVIQFFSRSSNSFKKGSHLEAFALLWFIQNTIFCTAKLENDIMTA
jgi:hypothetical protein